MPGEHLSCLRKRGKLAKCRTSAGRSAVGGMALTKMKRMAMYFMANMPKFSKEVRYGCGLQSAKRRIMQDWSGGTRPGWSDELQGEKQGKGTKEKWLALS